MSRSGAEEVIADFANPDWRLTLRKKGIVLLFLLASVACASAPGADPGGAWEQDVRAAEQRHRAAFLARDVATLQAMFSDDFVVNSPLNVIVNKERLLEMVRNGTLTISSFEQNIEQVRRLGDVVVVMGGDTVVYAAPSPNAGRTDRRRFTDMWRQESGQWRFVARQANIICP